MRGTRFLQVGAGAPSSSYDETFRQQLAKFAKARGTDRSPQPPQNIPRTTLADVSELVKFWLGPVHEYAQAQSPSLLDVAIGPLALFFDRKVSTGGRADAVVQQWLGQAKFVEMYEAGKTMPETAVYPFNANLWHATMTLATELATTKEAPTKAELAKESATQAIHDDLPSQLGSVGKYILIGAGVIGGALIVGELIAKGAK